MGPRVQLNSLSEIGEHVRDLNFKFPPSPVHINLFSQKLTPDNVSALCDAIRVLEHLVGLDLGRLVARGR